MTTTWKAWKAVLQKNDGFWIGAGRLGGAIFISIFTIPFLGGEILGLAFLAHATTVYIIPLILALAGLSALFLYLMKRPTGPGRQVMDQIEGFRRYLAAVEADRLHRLHPPDKTPELFEKYLPYALALDVEHEWAEQFTDLLTQAGQVPGGSGYQPVWYHSRSFDASNLGGFSGSLGSFLSGAIASSSRAPGSSSGGGGGGGGGGW